MSLRNVSLVQSDGVLTVDGVEVSRHRAQKDAIEAALGHLDQDPQPVVEYVPQPIRIFEDGQLVDEVFG